MNDLLLNLKEKIINGHEEAIRNNEQHSKQNFLDLLLFIGAELSKRSEESKTEPVEKIKEKHSRNSYDEQTRKNMYLVAFCFSYFEHEALYPGLKQKKAMQIAAETLGVDFASFKNYRDLFDGHNNNRRKGWHNSKMPPLVQEAKDEYENMQKSVLIKKAQKILHLPG